jgi:hypothetical protein
MALRRSRYNRVAPIFRARVAFAIALAVTSCGDPAKPKNLTYRVTTLSPSPVAGASVTFIAELLNDGTNESEAGRVVTWTVTGSTGTPTSGSSTTDASGAAVFSHTTSITAGETFTVKAMDADGTTTGTSSGVTTVAGAATKYITTASTATPIAGAQVTVTAVLSDANGNGVHTSGRTVTWSKTGAGGSFASPTSTTDANGSATVVFTTASTVGTSYVITATDNSSLNGSSGQVVTTIGPASKYVVTPSVTSLTVGTTLTVSAQLADANGNAVATAGRVVSWTGAASFSNATSTTNASGVATVTVTAPTTAGTFTVTGTDAGSFTGTSVSITATAGTASKYVVTASTTQPQSGGTVVITAQLADANDNAISTAGKTITWTKTGTGGSLSSATSSTNASGQATVTLTTEAVVGTHYTIGASDGTLSGTSPDIVTVAGIPRYTVTSSSSTPVAGAAVTITAQLVDGAGATTPTAGKVVTWTKTGTGGSFASPTSTTNASGVATVVFTTGAGPSHTVTGTDAQGLTGTTSSIDVTAGTPTSLVATGNEIVIINPAATTTPAFQVLNENGVAISNPSLTFVSRTTAAATVNGTSGLVTGVALGQSVIVATSSANPSLKDSALVAVGSATGPSLALDLTSLDLTSSATLVVNLVADMRASGEKLGAMTTQITWDPAQLTFVSDAEPTTAVGAVVNSTNATNGSLTVSIASSTGLSGSTAIRKLTFTVTATKNKTALVSILPTEFIAATSLTDLLSKTIAIRYPLITK